MDNTIGVLWLLGVGLCVGWHLRERFAAPALPQAWAVGLPHEGGRVAQDRCRCQQCQPAFMQESPPEEQ